MEQWLYVMFIEKTKTYNRLTKAAVERHVENLRQLDDAGHIALAGVFKGYSGVAGMYILKADSLEEAEALWALFRYLKKRGATLGGLFAPAPALPPHVEAIQALEELHNRKLWQNNRHKQYYSGLTDILRSYIARRWEVGAMEMTTDEILGALRPLDLPDKARMDLTAILREGDLVKFAKATPDAETNENAYLKAYYFVEETKPATEQAEPNAENE